MDINLLADTKDAPSERKKPTPPPETPYSAPLGDRREEPKAKPPSGIRLWVKGLFAAKPEAPKRDAASSAPAPKLKVPRNLPEPESVAAPTDIFAEVDRPTTAAPTARPAVTPPPSGLRPLGHVGAPPPPVPTPLAPTPVMRPVPPPVAPSPVGRPPGRPGGLNAGRLPTTALPRPVRSGAAVARGNGPPPTSPGGFLVNLLPAELAVDSAEVRQRLLLLGLIAAITSAVVVGVYFTLAFYESNVSRRVAAVKDETTDVDARIHSLRAVQREANAFVMKVSALDTALQRHIRWSFFFDRLERYTLPTVSYGGTFQGTTGTTLALTGTAPAVDDVARQLAVFQRSAPDLATAARLEGVTRGADASGVSADVYTFTITLTLAPDVFVTPPSAAPTATL